MRRDDLRGAAVGATAAPVSVAVPRGLSRRTVVKGAAWSVPVLMLANAAPAFAASPQDVGPLMESSAYIGQDELRMSAMFLLPSAGGTGAALQSAVYDMTITVSYSGPTGEWDLTKATNRGFWAFAPGATPTTLVLTLNGQLLTSNQGILACIVAWNLPAGFVIPSGTITVRASGTGSINGVLTYKFDDALTVNINGEQGPSPAQPLVGPYFAVPGGYSQNAAVAGRNSILGAVAGVATAAPVMTVADGVTTVQYPDGHTVVVNGDTLTEIAVDESGNVVSTTTTVFASTDAIDVSDDGKISTPAGAKTVTVQAADGTVESVKNYDADGNLIEPESTTPTSDPPSPAPSPTPDETPSTTTPDETPSTDEGTAPATSSSAE